MSTDVDFSSVFDPEEPPVTLADLFSGDGGSGKKRGKRRDEDDKDEVSPVRFMGQRPAPKKRVNTGTNEVPTAAQGLDAIEVDHTNMSEIAKGAVRDAAEAMVYHETQRLAGHKPKKAAHKGGQQPGQKRAAKGEGLSGAERVAKYRAKLKENKEAVCNRDVEIAEATASAMRSSSPLRELRDESTEPIQPTSVYQGADISGNQVMPARCCTIHTWVMVNGTAFVAAKQRELEDAVKSWMNNRDNKAWRQALQGGGAGATTAFERSHPCRAKNLPDVTQCDSFAALDSVLAAHGGGGNYIGAINGAFHRSIDLSSIWSGRVHTTASSDRIIMRAKRLQPEPNDLILYHFLRHDHNGHWRMACEHTVFASWDIPADKLADDTDGLPHYAHCTLKDVSQVLRNPALVESMTDPLRRREGQ